jgi:hypothetical protein
MDLRTKITDAMKQAMRDKAAQRLATLRLVNAAIKDREISLRGTGKEEEIGDAQVLGILEKMTKQRRESARVYEEGGRLDFAERELAEIEVLAEFLPKQLSDEDVSAAIDAVLVDIGASSIRDMGKIMGALKGKYAGQMDFGAVGAMVKAKFS